MRHVHILCEDSCAEFDVSAQTHGTIAPVADALVESPKGYLKDLNPHQAKKTFEDVADESPGRSVITSAARCREGLGQPVLEEWMPSTSRRHDLIHTMRCAFRHGGHTLATGADLLGRATLYLTPEVPDDVARQFRASPNHSRVKGLSLSRARLGLAAGILVVSHGYRFIAESGTGVTS